MGDKTDDKGIETAAESAAGDDSSTDPAGDTKAADPAEGKQLEIDGPGDDVPAEGDETPAVADADDKSKTKDPAKQKAGKASGKARADAATRRRELRGNKDVQKLLADAKAEGAKEAQERARRDAEREKMSEVERAKAEAADAKAEAKAARERADAAALDRDYATAVMESDVQIRPKARGTVKTLVAEAMAEDESLSVADALAAVVAEHDYVVQPASAPPSDQRTSTTPAPKKTTAKPAEPDPKKPVDVSEMTPQQFKQYQFEVHGIRN